MNQTEAEGRPADRRSPFQQSEGVPEQTEPVGRGRMYCFKIRGGERENEYKSRDTEAGPSEHAAGI